MIYINYSSNLYLFINSLKFTCFEIKTSFILVIGILTCFISIYIHYIYYIKNKYIYIYIMKQ